MIHYLLRRLLTPHTPPTMTLAAVFLGVSVIVFATLPTTTLVTTMLFAILAWLIAHGSRTATWTYVVLVGFDLFATLVALHLTDLTHVFPDFPSTLSYPLYMTLSWSLRTLNVAAALLLTTPSARRWRRSHRNTRQPEQGTTR